MHKLFNSAQHPRLESSFLCPCPIRTLGDDFGYFGSNSLTIGLMFFHLPCKSVPKKVFRLCLEAMLNSSTSAVIICDLEKLKLGNFKVYTMKIIRKGAKPAK